MVNINLEKEEGYDIMKVVGEVDASSSIALDQSIEEQVKEGPRDLLIDCTQLDYISSAGFGVFMSYIEEFKANEKKLVIYGLSQKVANVFAILGLDQLLTIKPTAEEAKAVL
jgi:anti-sigma B factor antagonist